VARASFGRSEMGSEFPRYCSAKKRAVLGVSSSRGRRSSREAHDGLSSIMEDRVMPLQPFGLHSGLHPHRPP
jgi:hypothetical protein